MADEVFEVEGQVEVAVGDKCRICNKPLRTELSVERGIGIVCARRLDKLMVEGETLPEISEERLSELVERIKASPDVLDEVPEGYISVANMNSFCHANEIPVSWMVRAIGGDRGQYPALSGKWSPIYVSRKRYIAGECMTEEGITELTEAFKREQKPKKVKVEGEPSKRGRKSKKVVIDNPQANYEVEVVEG